MGNYCTKMNIYITGIQEDNISFSKHLFAELRLRKILINLYFQLLSSSPGECEAGAKLRLSNDAGSMLAPAEPRPLSLSLLTPSSRGASGEPAATPSALPSSSSSSLSVFSISSSRLVLVLETSPEEPMVSPCPESSEDGASSMPASRSMEPLVLSTELTDQSPGRRDESGSSGVLTMTAPNPEPGRGSWPLVPGQAAATAADSTQRAAEAAGRTGTLSLSLAGGGREARADGSLVITGPLSGSAGRADTAVWVLALSVSPSRGSQQQQEAIRRRIMRSIVGVVKVLARCQQGHLSLLQPVPSLLNDHMHATKPVRKEAVTQFMEIFIVIKYWETDSVMVNPIGARCSTAIIQFAT